MTSPPAALGPLLAKRNDFVTFLERRVGDRALAEDILQDAFAKSASTLAGLRDEESAVAWFYRVLRNAVIDHARRSNTAKAAIARFAAEVEEAVPPPEVRAAVCQCVARLAERLTPEHAEILRRVEVEDMTVRAYAEETGIAPGTAAVRVHRAREALRRAVVVSCGPCAKHGCLECTCSATPG